MPATVRFGAFEFDAQQRELRKHGLRIRVPDQSLEILTVLVEHPGDTVTRDRIQALLWPNGTVVGFERSINAAVKRLREALGDPADKACFIERVPRQGYRFIAPVHAVARTGTPPPDARAGTMLAHYRLVERAGSGSMGEMWKAEDTKLGRTVALKLFPRQVTADVGTLEVIRQEARHLAALNHPSICTIHGLEEHGGQSFLVMEYIDGLPLTAVLEGDRLPAQRVAEIGVQIARALACAHSNGVIHRDVKPANVMLTAGGIVKLTDFGIAQAAPRLAGAAPATNTEQSPAGTLGYLSPEQARGGPLDARSDIFSLGVVLYEMATGRRPFRGDTPAAVLRALTGQQPARPRSLNPGMPRDLERVILKALEKDTALRWQDAGALAEALEPVAARRRARYGPLIPLAAAGVIAAVFAGWFWWRPTPPLAERDAIVIADFQNTTGDAVFDRALRQSLLSQMGQSPYLSIVSEERIGSSLKLMGGASSQPLTRSAAREVCRRVGGKAVLAGSVGMLGGRYFIGLEAVGCAGGGTLATEYAEASSREQVLSAVGRVASGMRRRLGESLASIRKLSALPEATTPSLEALQAFALALHNRATGNDPVPLLERAIQMDPDFATAYFTLARIRMARCEDAKAEAAITRAFALRGHASQGERLAIEGLYHLIASGDASQVLAVTTLAGELYPHDPSTWRWSVLAHGSFAESDKALDVARREVQEAPADGGSYFDLAAVLASSGKTAESRAALEMAAPRGAGSELFPFVRYLIAAVEDDSGAMEREAESVRGKPFEFRVRILELQTAGLHGRLARSRKIAHDASERNTSGAPALLAAVALTEAVFGLEQEARARATEAIRLDRGRRTAATCALTLALAHDTAAAESILNELLHKYPFDTLLKIVWAPAVRGAIALSAHDADGAVKQAEAPGHTARYGWPPYVRGLAYLKLGHGEQAAAEFRAILERRTALLATAFTYGAGYAYPAARLGLARALAKAGQSEASRKAYEEFLAGWKQADSDIPILIQAKAEYAALRRTSSD